MMAVFIYLLQKNNDALVKKEIGAMDKQEVEALLSTPFTIVKEIIFSKKRNIFVRYLISWDLSYLRFSEEAKISFGDLILKENPPLKVDKSLAVDIIYFFLSKKKANFVDIEMKFNIDIASGTIRDPSDSFVERILNPYISKEEAKEFYNPNKVKRPKKSMFPFEKELRGTLIYQDYLDFYEFLYFEIKQLRKELKKKDVKAIKKSILDKRALAKEIEIYRRKFHRKLTEDEKMFLKYVYYSRLFKGRCPYCGSKSTRWRYSDKTVRVCLKCKSRYRIVPKSNIPYYKIDNIYGIFKD